MHMFKCEKSLLTGSVMNAKIFKFGFRFFIAEAFLFKTVSSVPAYITDFSMRNSSGAFCGKFELYDAR